MSKTGSLNVHLAALVLSAIIPLGVFAFLIVNDVVYRQEEAIETALAQRTDVLAGAIERHLQVYLETLHGLADSQELRAGNLSAFYGLAKRRSARQSDGVWVVLADATGQQVVNTLVPYGAPLPVRPDMDTVREVLTRRAALVSNVHPGIVAKVPLVTVSVPALRGEQPAFELMLAVPTDIWRRVLAEQHLPDEWIATLTDRAGAVIASTHLHDQYVGKPAFPLLRDVTVSSDIRGLVTGHTVEGIGVRTAFVKMGAYGWTVAIAVPLETLHTPARKSLMTLAFGAGIALLLGLLGSALVARRLAHAMSVLSSAAMAFGRGEAVALPGLAVREAEDVVRSFYKAAEIRDLAERDVRLASARLTAIVETAVDAIVVSDETGTIQSVNPAASRFFGYEAEEMIGQNVRMLMPDAERSEHDAYIANYHRTGEARIIGIGRELEGRRKDGSMFPIDVSIAAWGVDGKRFFTAIMRDITERSEAEHQLQQSRLLLETMIESIPDPVFVKDADGRYLLVNEKSCRVFAIERGKVLGARDRDFFLPHVAATMENSDKRVMSTGEVVSQEEELPDVVNGAPHLYLTTKAPLRNVAGSVIGVVGIARDITQSKRAEDALRAAKSEAERANVTKSKFLASASHDLRQPVQSLILFMAALKGQLEGTSSVRLLNSMEQSLDGLRALLEGLLDVSKLDAGLVVAKPVAMPITPVIDRLGDEYGPRAAELGLKFRTISSDAVVKSDPVLLERILRNLVENALRYTVRGGVLVGCRRRGDRLRVEIVDTGIGIAPERQDEVFEEFFQLGNPERDRSKGLGLGLAVVRRLAHLLGHDTDVRSIPGRGSTFAIELPLAANADVVLEGAPVHPFAKGNGIVLVIDDEELVRQGMQAMLEGWGYQVLTAGSRDGAVAVLGDRRPDIILADYRLRDGETGLDAIQTVHVQLGVTIPAAIVTGDTAPERLAEAKAGGCWLLHKPLAAAELRQAVSELMNAAKARA